MNPQLQPAVRRFTKIAVDGKPLDDDATDWVAVHDARTGLMWSKDDAPGGAMTWQNAMAAADAVSLCGFHDWRMPTLDELETLRDLTRHDPSINTEFFPGCQSSWYWTSTPAANSPADYAWFVFFYGGGADWVNRNFSGFVRAVRPSQS